MPKSYFFLHMSRFCTYFICFFISQSDEYGYKPISNHKEMKSTVCFRFFSLHTISIKPKCATQRQYLSESSHLHDVRAERLSSSRRPAAGSSLKMMRTSVASLHWVTASMIVVAMEIFLGA